MPSKIRFHLDENISPKIAAGLRRHGVDVTTAYEAGLLGAVDSEQLSYATKHGRMLVTRDRDFLAMYAERYKHAGICYCHPQNRNIGTIVRTLTLLWGNATADDVRGYVTYL